MRSALLILLPIALLAAAFYVFVVRTRPAMLPAGGAAQVDAEPTTRRMVPTTIASVDPSASVIGPSGNVWVQTLNRRTGEVANEFRASRFDPRPDGAVDVTFPQARFYGEKGGVVTLEGSGGKVSLTQPGNPSNPQAIGASTPTDGDLKDVIIRFYDDSLDQEPSLIAQVPAVHFDAIGNRISTVDSVIDGKGVPAEQVPINVRGRDFEFDGYGLTMSWNDRGGRLESLEVNRGERLLIKNIAKFNLPQHANARRTSPFVTSPAAMVVGVVAQASTAPAARQQLYHAAFEHDVKVSRDGTQLAAADLMNVILPLGDERAAPSTPAAGKRPHRPASDRAVVTQSHGLPGRQPSLPRRRPPTRPARSKSAGPASSPSAPPSAGPISPRVSATWSN